MTDEQIKKALDFCCGNHGDDIECTEEVCYQCALPEDREDGVRWCRQWLIKDALDLINRLNERDKKNERIIELADKTIKAQSAEIERLQKAGEEAVSCFTRMESLYKIKCKELEVAKSEAIKEFAERYENLIIKQFNVVTMEKQEVFDFCLDELRNLKKEMVGDDNA